MTYRVLSLFAGIGGFDLGLERTGGFKTVAFCEIDPFCQKVLAKHWPGVPIYDDVRTLTAERLAEDGIEPDCIVGGFPCQDLSFAGKGAGLAGERSGLWREYARIIRELRPRVIIVENVSALLARGLGAVLGDLASIGYDAEWHCIPAAAVGAPHIRDRIWIIAYSQHPDAHGAGSHRAPVHVVGSAEPAHQQVRLSGPLGALLADAGGVCGEPRRAPGDLAGAPGEGQGDSEQWQRHGDASDNRRADVADANGAGLEGWLLDRQGASQWPAGKGCRSVPGRWLAEPDVGRVAHGVPSRVDRLRSLGNAVVPQIPEMIGRAIIVADQARKEAA